MSAFTQIITDWAPLVGGLCGFVAFGELLWRKLIIGPRNAKAARCLAVEANGVRADLARVSANHSAATSILSRVDLDEQ